MKACFFMPPTVAGKWAIVHGISLQEDMVSFKQARHLGRLVVIQMALELIDGQSSDLNIQIANDRQQMVIIR